MEIQETFTVELEKLMSNEIQSMCWSNAMDLFALIIVDNSLELHRISSKPQKVFQIQEKQVIVGLQFSPDSFFLLYACEDGSLYILKTENGERIIQLEKVHNVSIVNLNWVNFYKSGKGANFNPMPRYSTIDKFILPVNPHAHSDRKNIMKLKYLSEINENSEFLMLVSTDIVGNVIFSVNALYPVVKMNVKNYLVQEALGQCEVNASLFINDFSELHLFISGQKAGQNNQSLYLMTINSNIFHYYREDISKIGYIMSYIDNLILFLKNTFNSLYNQIPDIAHLFEVKMSIFEDILKNHNINQQGQEELLRFLNSGVCSSALQQFLSKELYDTKILQQLDDNLNSHFNNVQDLIVESTQNTLQRVLLLSSNLESLAKVEKYQLLGLEQQQIQRMQDSIKGIYSLCEELLLCTIETKQNIRNLLVWLNKNVIKTSQENEVDIENSKSELNKYTVDVKKLYNFLSNNDKFQLKELKSFLNSKSDSIIIEEEMQMENKENVFQSPSKDSMKNRLFDYTLSNLNQIVKDEYFQPPGVELGDLKNVESHYSQLFESNRKSNLTQMMKQLEKMWVEISSKLQNKMSGYLKPKEIIKIGTYTPKKIILRHFTQQQVKDQYSFAVDGKSLSKDSLQVYKIISQSGKVQMQMSQFEIYQNYELKDFNFNSNGQVVVLLQGYNKNLEKKEALVGVVNEEKAKQSQVTNLSSQQNKEEVQTQVSTQEAINNQIQFSKSIQFGPEVCSKLSLSLRGLYSVLQEGNKVIIFD